MAAIRPPELERTLRRRVLCTPSERLKVVPQPVKELHSRARAAGEKYEKGGGESPFRVEAHNMRRIVRPQETNSPKPMALGCLLSGAKKAKDFFDTQS